MSMTAHFLSRMTPADLNYRDLAALGGLDPYGQHQRAWKFFDLPSNPAPPKTPFLFRAEVSAGLPTFYILSTVEPSDPTSKWRIESKPYRPRLSVGERLAFKLRANPVVERPGDVLLDSDGAPKLRTSGSKAGHPKRRVKRHDVVMDAKQRMDWKTTPIEDRPSLAQLAHEAGSCWLREREERLGCQFDAISLRADGYRVHRMYRRRGITLSTLDFEGELVVTDAEGFIGTLLKGIGPAKAFGCGLLLVRRILSR